MRFLGLSGLLYHSHIPILQGTDICTVRATLLILQGSLQAAPLLIHFRIGLSCSTAGFGKASLSGGHKPQRKDRGRMLHFYSWDDKNRCDKTHAKGTMKTAFFASLLCFVQSLQTAERSPGLFAPLHWTLYGGPQSLAGALLALPGFE